MTTLAGSGAAAELVVDDLNLRERTPLVLPLGVPGFRGGCRGQGKLYVHPSQVG